MGMFSSFESGSGLMKVGPQIVSLKSLIECTTFDGVSFVKDQGLVITEPDVKRAVAKWSVPTQQVAILVVNEQGAVFHRLSLDAWLLNDRIDHYTQEMRESGLYIPVGKYVCQMVNGQLQRVPSPNGRAHCEKIIREFLFALTKGVAGIGADLAVESAIVNKTKFMVNVINEVYEGKLQTKLDPDTFKPYMGQAPAVQAEELDDDLKS